MKKPNGLNPALVKSEFEDTSDVITVLDFNEGEYINKVKLDIDGIQYGYISDGIHDYDLIQDDGWTISYRQEYMDIDTAKVFVVTDLGEKLAFDLDF